MKIATKLHYVAWESLQDLAFIVSRSLSCELSPFVICTANSSLTGVFIHHISKTYSQYCHLQNLLLTSNSTCILSQWFFSSYRNWPLRLVTIDDGRIPIGQAANSPYWTKYHSNRHKLAWALTCGRIYCKHPLSHVPKDSYLPFQSPR